MCGCVSSSSILPSAPPIGGIKKTKKQKDVIEPEPEPESLGFDDQYIRDRLMMARDLYCHEYGYVIGNGIIKEYPQQLINSCLGLEVFTREVTDRILTCNKSDLSGILPLLILFAKCKSNPQISTNIDLITLTVSNNKVGISNDDLLLVLREHYRITTSYIYSVVENIFSFPKFVASYINEIGDLIKLQAPYDLANVTKETVAICFSNGLGPLMIKNFYRFTNKRECFDKFKEFLNYKILTTKVANPDKEESLIVYLLNTPSIPMNEYLGYLTSYTFIIGDVIKCPKLYENIDKIYEYIQPDCHTLLIETDESLNMLLEYGSIANVEWYIDNILIPRISKDNLKTRFNSLVSMSLVSMLLQESTRTRIRQVEIFMFLNYKHYLDTNIMEDVIDAMLSMYDRSMIGSILSYMLLVGSKMLDKIRSQVEILVLRTIRFTKEDVDGSPYVYNRPTDSTSWTEVTKFHEPTEYEFIYNGSKNIIIQDK